MSEAAELDFAVNEYMLSQGHKWLPNNPHNIYKGIWIKDGQGMTHEDATELYLEAHKHPWWKFWEKS